MHLKEPVIWLGNEEELLKIGHRPIVSLTTFTACDELLGPA